MNKKLKLLFSSLFIPTAMIVAPITTNLINIENKINTTNDDEHIHNFSKSIVFKDFDGTSVHDGQDIYFIKFSIIENEYNLMESKHGQSIKTINVYQRNKNSSDVWGKVISHSNLAVYSGKLNGYLAYVFSTKNYYPNIYDYEFELEYKDNKTNDIILSIRLDSDNKIISFNNDYCTKKPEEKPDPKPEEKPGGNPGENPGSDNGDVSEKNEYNSSSKTMAITLSIIIPIMIIAIIVSVFIAIVINKNKYNKKDLSRILKK